MFSLMKLEVNESALVNIRVEFLQSSAWRFNLENTTTGPGGASSAGVPPTPHCLGEEAVDVSILSLAEEGACLRLHLSIDGIQRHARCVVIGDDVHLTMDQATYRISNITFKPRRPGVVEGDGDILSPSNGLLASVEVCVGQHVERGAPVCTVEAMKLIQPVNAPISGYVTAILAEAGKQVKAKQLLIRMEEKLRESKDMDLETEDPSKKNATLVEV
jgi:biotin carboxyl carrier protein